MVRPHQPAARDRKFLSVRDVGAVDVERAAGEDLAPGLRAHLPAALRAPVEAEALAAPLFPGHKGEGQGLGPGP